MASQGGKADVVFMDPPRSGSTEEFINAVATLKARPGGVRLLRPRYPGQGPGGV